MSKTLFYIAYLNGEYNAYNVCAAVPVVLGKDGIEKIIDLKLTNEEIKDFTASVKKSQIINAQLKSILH